jgi:threonyl-tRNA synthetase
VRILPVSSKHTGYAEEICNKINSGGVRCDFDDREESVGKKIREAGMDWVPYVVVVGDSEMESGKLTVTIRNLSKPKVPYKEEITPDELISRVKEDIGGRPFRPIYTSKKLSVKPRFI